ncbi:type IV toxin-antitoxin system AbiEi family antitoxin domain-containing protein [Gordonia rhizosphera]|uniref:DUF559 domain-containing protein n=1 Tax=Gordonia rhizosphera NBRC 16068 TaxID=1108045 RepID=K6WA25_9ACTN|nr:type IV toxin-antitoxin system AbiEi family antitoxin domain-containing protein [Gordonia rhizosphera]GAB89062.1 hypothetical protein GORHZ_048_00390 [Gordonia rhizosphera NBRC 16068]
MENPHAYGVYSRAELIARGENDASLRRAIREGTLERPRRGWYAFPTADETVVQAVRKGGVLSCVSALRHYGFWIPPGHDSLHARASRHHGKRKNFCKTPGRPLPIHTAVDPIADALMCAAQCMTAEDWIIVADSILNSTQLSVRELLAAMPQMNRVILRRITKCDARSQSGTETAVRLRLRARGFHVVVQPSIRDVGVVDLRVGRLLLECDSKLYHTSLENYRKDRRRDRKALARGLTTMRLTYDDVMFGWDETLADITTFTDADRHRPRRRRKLAP